MNIIKKISILIIFSLIFMIVLSGCSSTKSKSEKSKGVDKKTIYVGTQPDFPPYNYTDESGSLTGYDIELVREIFKELPQYNLKFKATSWDGITLGLESNRTQMIADQMSINEERKQKYYLSKPYYNNQIFIVVKRGRTDIQSLEDLKGKTLELVVGTTPATAIEKWNSKNGNKINIKYTKATNYTDPLQDVANDRVDAYVENLVNINSVIKKQNLQIQAIGKPVLELSVAFVFKKDKEGKQLQNEIDKVIDKLKADGTMKNLSIKWTGVDSIPK